MQARLPKKISEIQKKKIDAQYTQEAEALFIKLKTQAELFDKFSIEDIHSIVEKLICFPTQFSLCKNSFEKAELVRSYSDINNQYEKLQQTASSVKDILNKEWHDGFKLNQKLSRFREKVEFITAHSSTTNICQIHSEFADIFKYVLNPQPITETLEDLFKDIEQFRTKDFYDNFNNLEYLEEKVKEFNLRINTLRNTLKKISPIFSEGLWLKQITIANEKFDSLILSLNNLSKACEKEIIQPACDAIWNIKNAVEILALQIAGKWPAEIKRAQNQARELPIDIKKIILTSLPLKTKFAWRSTSKENKSFSDQHLFYQVQNQYYYAVGLSISLYEKRYNAILSAIYEVNVEPDAQQMYDSLKTPLRLFTRLSDAIFLSQCNSALRLNTKFDVFENSYKAPIFVVKVKNSGSLELKQHEFQDSWQWELKGKVVKNTIKYFTTNISNLENIAYSKLFETGDTLFNLRLTPKQANKLLDQFSLTWNQAYSTSEKDLNVTAKQCLIALFKTYKSWFWTRFTRHHHKEVEEILKYANEYHTLTEWMTFLNNKLINLPSNIAKTGHYYQMLNFAIEQLKNLQPLETLRDLPDFLTPKK